MGIVTVVGWLIRITKKSLLREERESDLHPPTSLSSSVIKRRSRHTRRELAWSLLRELLVFFFTGNSALDSASFVVPVTTPRHIFHRHRMSDPNANAPLPDGWYREYSNSQKRHYYFRKCQNDHYYPSPHVVTTRGDWRSAGMVQIVCLTFFVLGLLLSG